MMARSIRIVHTRSGSVVAEGPIGWGIVPFEGNYYIAKRYLRATFQPNFVPGLCIYKFLYVWMDLVLHDGMRVKSLGWLYWLPNPLLPFIWFRVAVSGSDPELTVSHLESSP